MKAASVLLRWYKSFNINYLGYDDRQPDIVKRPWNGIASPSESAYRFIEIPIRPDITTIVGANESGKSHLLSALRKVVHGSGIPEFDDTVSEFNVTDLCHYASVQDKNASSWPNLGVTFSDVSDEEVQSLVESIGSPSSPNQCSEMTLILAHSPSREAVIYFGRSDDGIDISADQLDRVRKILPSVEFIRSNTPLPGELPIDDLLAGSVKTEKPYVGFDLAQAAARIAISLAFDKDNKVAPDLVKQVEEFQKSLKQPKSRPSVVASIQSLETQLFKDVLGIEDPAIELLASISPEDRGFAEGLVATWNQELDRKLNLRRFWQQDDQFALSLDFKAGWFYFEIRDKTGSVYTFRERSSGLRFFLSYYIQAKSIESRFRNRSCIVLMDEPDSFLSIAGQKNLLAVFESLVSSTSGNPKLQLVYTTHSPFLINPNYPYRIRLVRKGDAEEGSQHISETMLRRYEPVRSALGIDCAQTLFMGEANLLLEGPSDQFLLIELIRVFAQHRKVPPVIDLSSIVVMSAESASGVAKILDASKWGDERIPATVVLFDADDEGKMQRDRVVGKAKLPKLIDEKFALLISDAFNSDQDQVVSSEDIIPSAAYGEAVKDYIKQWYPEHFKDKENEIEELISNEVFSKNGNAAGAQAVFDKSVFDKKRDFDKMGIIHIVIDRIKFDIETKPEAEYLNIIQERLDRLLLFLRQRIEESRHESQKASARQAIVRSSNDFFKRFKNAAEAFEVQLHLERLVREIDSISDDFAELAKILDVLLREVRELRTSGDLLLEGNAWYRWSSLLFAIKKNPLSPEISVESNRAEPKHLWNPENDSKLNNDSSTSVESADDKSLTDEVKPI